MTDIVQFLSARLDEDQRAAEYDQQHRDAGSEVRYASGADFTPALGRLLLDVQFNPARVLREVAAKRAIVEQWKQAAERNRRDECDEGAGAMWAALCYVLVSLAGVHDSHSDYAGNGVDDWQWPDDDPAWRVE